MQALKALVIFLGALIVIMMGILAYGIATKFGDVVNGGDAEGPGAPIGAPVMAEPWETVRIGVPGGARVAETVVAEGRMVVRLELPDGSQRYLVFDLDVGQQIGTVDLVPEGEGQ